MLSETVSLTEKPSVQYKVTYMYKSHCSMNYTPYTTTTLISDDSRSKEDQRQRQ